MWKREERTITAYVIIHRNKEWNKNRDLPGQKNTVKSRRKLQYRDTDYNRCTVTVNKKINNHKSVSKSNYKTINNFNIYLLSEVYSEYSCHLLIYFPRVFEIYHSKIYSGIHDCNLTMFDCLDWLWFTIMSKPSKSSI